MAKREKTYMPAGIGGLIRYQEEGKSLIKIKPKQVIGLVISVVVLEVILQLMFL